MNYAFKTVAAWIIVALAILPWSSYGQETAQPLFSQEEIEQIVAPIALYPDPLVAQVLMASTYPIEIVSEARWMQENLNLSGQALQDALQQQTWDPSVKSLTTVPDVLSMMNDKLDMTQRLGDAFLAQPNDVMNAIQDLRAKAMAAGTLNSSSQQVVSMTPADTAEGIVTSTITIESTDPDVLYVPTYDPNYVYGTWPYPSYPPYYYYPYGYAPGTAFLSFAAGVAVGNALWGYPNWRNGNLNINVNRYNSFNRTTINNTNWTHNVGHRAGVPYRDVASQQKFGKGELPGYQSREVFRGRAEQSRQAAAPAPASMANTNWTQRIDQTTPRINQTPHTNQGAARREAIKPSTQEQRASAQVWQSISAQQQRVSAQTAQNLSAQSHRVNAQTLHNPSIQPRRVTPQTLQNHVAQQPHRINVQTLQNHAAQPRVNPQQLQRAAANFNAGGQGAAAFEGINHGAQVRNFSNRGAASLASSRAAAVNRGGFSGGGAVNSGGWRR